MHAFIGSLLLVCCWWANAADSITMNVDPSAKEFKVTLAANPTTGYQWSVKEYDKTLLKLKSSNYQRPQSKLIGAGGQMVYTFVLRKGQHYPQQTKMLFSYARAWEPSSATSQTVIVSFSVSQ